MADDLEKLVADAKRIAESRGLDVVAYLLALAEAELPKEKFKEPPEPMQPFDRGAKNDN